MMQIHTAHIAAEEQISRLRSMAIVAPLAVPVLLRLARRLVPFSITAGAVIISEGAVGDRFYIVRDGEVTVSRQGHRLATFGPHGFFGEIALLRDVLRTASVSADIDTSLYALGRSDFPQADTGHAASLRAAGAITGARPSEQEEVLNRP